MSFEKLKAKLIITLILISSVPLILFAVVIYEKEVKLVRKKALSHLETIVDQSTLMIAEFRLERIRDLSLVAATTQGLGGLCGTTHLRHFQAEYEIYRNIFMIDKKGRIVCQAIPALDPGAQFVDRSWFKAAVEGKSVIADTPSYERGGGRDLLIAIPVKSSNNRITGILGAVVDFQGITNIMKNTGIGKTGEIYLLNRDGVFLTTTRLGRSRAGETMPPELFAEYFNEVRTGEYVDYRGRSVVRVHRNLPDTGWYIVGEQDSAEVLKDIASLRNLFAGFVALLIILITGTGYLISTRIVHLLRSAYAQKKDLEMQVIQKDKLASMGLLTAGIAHELNTPLASALLYTQMLKEDAENARPASVEKLSSIEGEIKRGSKIVRNLLDFSRQSQTSSVTTDVNEVLDKLLDISEQLCADRGIEIRRNFEKNLPAAKGNASILHQVFMNIVANAVDAMENGGVLSVVTRYIAPLHRDIIEIQDTGTGIPEDLLNDVFDPFFTTKLSGEGTGLGLAISYSMVRKMGGNIRVTSTCNREGDGDFQTTGTTFTVELPALDQDQEAAEKERTVSI